MMDSVANNAHGPEPETQAAFFARDTSRHTVKEPSEDSKHATKVDVGIYPNLEHVKERVRLKSEDVHPDDEPKPEVATPSNTVDTNAPGTTVAESHEPDPIKAIRDKWRARCSWADMLVPVEVKVDHSHSAFEFLSSRTKSSMPTCLRHTEAGYKSQAQFLNYVARIFAHQHRTHLYAVYIYKNLARIIYIDRGGCIVSTPFQYGTREHNTLHRFLWRLARMAPDQQGYDTSVRLASVQEIQSLVDYLRDAKTTPYIKDCIKHALSWSEEEKAPRPSLWPLYVVRHGTYQLLVGRPATHLQMRVFGRCTRGYVAFIINWENVRVPCIDPPELLALDKLDADRITFLKDNWRSDHADIAPEHQVYEDLYNLRKADERTQGLPPGAYHILDCFHGEDVFAAGHDTLMSRQTTKASDTGCRVHYRILLSPVCRPLSDFTNFKELALLLSQALQG